MGRSLISCLILCLVAGVLPEILECPSSPHVASDAGKNGCEPGYELKEDVNQKLTKDPIMDSNQASSSYQEIRCLICTECPPGTYSEDFPSMSCSKCPPGRITYQTGATSIAECRPCPPGKYRGPNSFSCEACPAGTYRGEDMAACSDCPNGRVAESEGQHECGLCPGGTYAFNKGFCKECALPYVTLQAGKLCHLCPAGTERAGPNSCQACPPGKYRRENSMVSCQECPAGYKCPDSSSTPVKCKRNRMLFCPAGSSTEVRAQDGFRAYRPILPRTSGPFTASTMTPPGRYSIGGEFQVCLPGTFQNEGGATRCKKCPQGRYVADRRRSSCTGCLDGETAVPGSVACAPGIWSAIAMHGGTEQGLDPGDRIRISFSAAIVPYANVGIQLSKAEVEDLILFFSEGTQGTHPIDLGDYYGVWNSSAVFDIVIVRAEQIDPLKVSVGDGGRLKFGVNPQAELRKLDYRENAGASYVNQGKTRETMAIVPIVSTSLNKQVKSTDSLFFRAGALATSYSQPLMWCQRQLSILERNQGSGVGTPS